MAAQIYRKIGLKAAPLPEKAFEWLNLATTAVLADYNRLINAKVTHPDAQKALDNWNTDNQQLEGMRRQLQDKY